MKSYKKLLRSFIKPVAVSLLMLASLTVTANAQNLDEAVELYLAGEYENAIVILNQLETPEAKLFTGKSYYSLGQYLRAKSHLAEIDLSGPDVPANIRIEARYTTALADFQLNQFGSALNILHEIRQIRPRSQIVNSAERLYNDILDYLTLAQRREVFYSANHTQVKTDIIKSAFGKVDYQTAKILLEEYQRVVTIEEDSTAFREMSQMVSDSLSYGYQMAFGNPITAPRGTVYDIGAALPQFDNTAVEFSVSQGLYFGYILAAEEFNQRNTEKKAFIRYQSTGADMDSAGHATTRLAWNYNIDALLGPLYSEPALRVAELAEQYQIPLVAPLANSDSLNIDNPYLYQANPTFASHGRRMARFAVKNLQMDTVAVLAESNSLGAASAYAFRNEVEKLGAHVAHFFVKDLESQGYEIADYTKYFTTDSTRIDTTESLHFVDGVYAPFTGQVAPTLIELMLIDLEAMNSRITVLGSQEWGASEIPERRISGRTIYFSESYYINSESELVEQFRKNFSERFGIEATEYAMIGYDTADFLLRVLERVENPALLKDAIKRQPLYEGLISKIDFNGTHVNNEVKIFRISDQGTQPATY